MLKELTKLANDLDDMNLREEADRLDEILRSYAALGSSPEDKAESSRKSDHFKQEVRIEDLLDEYFKAYLSSREARSNMLTFGREELADIMANDPRFKMLTGKIVGHVNKLDLGGGEAEKL